MIQQCYCCGVTKESDGNHYCKDCNGRRCGETCEWQGKICKNCDSPMFKTESKCSMCGVHSGEKDKARIYDPI